ncbi:MAG: hypothetical protein AAF599_12675, partial [Bacteroidota bacterium]
MKKLHPFIFYILALSFFLNTKLAMGQNINQEKMGLLNFMVGDWVGISTTYKDGVVDQKVPAFQKIQYAVDKSIITIDLHSETLQLHTVIYYDEKQKKYFYNPFYKRGANQYTAEYRDGKLIVTKDEKTRFIFHKTSEYGFQEYG